MLKKKKKEKKKKREKKVSHPIYWDLAGKLLSVGTCAQGFITQYALVTVKYFLFFSCFPFSISSKTLTHG